MAKPTGSIEWASDNAALKQEPSSALNNYGWSTSDNTISGTPPKPDLQHQNGWQYNVYRLLEWAANLTPWVIAASNSSTADKALADFVCGGSNDQVGIKSICDSAAASNRKTVMLLPGTYTFGAQLALAAHDDLKIIGQGLVKIVTSTDLTPYAISLDGDRMELHNIRFGLGASTNFENGITLAGSYLKVTGIIFETGSIVCKTTDETGTGLALVGLTNSLVEARFETESVENTQNTASSFARGVFLDHSATTENNKLNLYFVKRALFNSNSTNPYYDTTKYIERDAVPYTQYNDINTNWISQLGDAPLPPSDPTGLTIYKDSFRWVGGNMEFAFQQSWTGGETAFDWTHMGPPNIMPEVKTQALVTYTESMGVGLPYFKVAGTSAGPDQSQVSGWVFGLGYDGFRLYAAGSVISWDDFPSSPELFGPMGGVITVSIIF